MLFIHEHVISDIIGDVNYKRNYFLTFRGYFIQETEKSTIHENYRIFNQNREYTDCFERMFNYIFIYIIYWGIEKENIMNWFNNALLTHNLFGFIIFETQAIIHETDIRHQWGIL